MHQKALVSLEQEAKYCKRAHEICRGHILDRIVIPGCVFKRIIGEHSRCEVLIKEKVPLPDVQHELFYCEDETIRQLALFIIYSGFGDFTLGNVIRLKGGGGKLLLWIMTGRLSWEQQ